MLNKHKQPVMYSLVFGEGVMNDAVAVVLLGASMKLDETAVLSLPTAVAFV